MLDFVRRYQSYFFFVIATVVISSFLFFGASSPLNESFSREDRVVGKAIDGSDMSLLEISSLARFIATDVGDLLNGSRQSVPNLLNDGVIRKDFLGTGSAEILVRGNFELLKKELEQRVQRIKNYRGYEHPDAPFVSAKAVWQRFAPEINREWSLLQSIEEANEDTFGHLARLYHFQSSLSPEWLRRILMMHEQQYSQWLRPDPRLRQDDLSLFGFHSIVDWFGKDFIDLIAEFVHNAAIEAESRGYEVSLEETKGDLARNFSASIQRIEVAKLPLQISYKEQLRLLGMDESEAVGIWRKILLMRRYFSDRGNSVFLDRLPYSEFASIAKEQATIDLYQWPSSLNIASALDLFTFQTYLKAVAPEQTSDPLALPRSLFSVREVEKKYPELVAASYRAKVFAIDKREAALKASFQELWAYEIEEETWKQLRKEFPFLQSLSSKTADERFRSLETLDPVQRAGVDQFARLLLLGRHPEWIEETLSMAKGEEKELLLSDGKIQMLHIDDPKRLGLLFEQILSSPESSLSDLSRFESDQAVFRFENIEKIADANIKTFEAALKDGSMDQIVHRALDTQFPKLRLKLPPEQAVCELSEVKEEISALLLGDLKKRILAATDELADVGDHFASRRLATVALSARKDLQQNPNDSRWIRTEGDDPLIGQFKLQRVEKQITRTAEEVWMSKESFILVPNEWSPIHVDMDGGVSFIYLKSRQRSKEPILEQLSIGKEVLSSDVQRLLADKLLATMLKRQSVVIPLQPEQE